MGKNCQFVKEVPSEADSNVIGAAGEGDMNKDILAALTSVSAKLTDIETRISKTEDIFSPALPQVGKLVVACRWSTIYSTEP